jgi:hypothetical protein
MAEFLIFGVAYSEKETHIDWLLITREVENTLNGSSIVGKKFVVDLIKTKSATFRTVTLDSKKMRFVRGAEVHVYDDDFLTTSPDHSEANNLESLPRFVMPDDEIDRSLREALPLLAESD